MDHAFSDPDEQFSNTSPPRKSLWPVVIIIAVGAVLVFIWLNHIRPSLSLEQATEGPGIGQPLPMLQLEPLTGTSEGVSLDSLRGKVVLVNYWGPWCNFCVEEFPHLRQLWDQYRGNPQFAFISVSSDGHSQENIPDLKAETEKFLQSRGTTFPTYVDPDGANRQVLSSLTGMPGFGYPTTILLDRHGIIRALWIGYQPGYETQMEQLVSKYLEQK
jgi:cytochrome c biogenesis protein CcmG, thiol:disulfide interchange protein DsbE